MTTRIKNEYLYGEFSQQIIQSDKCGEIFVTELGIFTYFCNVCKQNFDEIGNFTVHILTLHLELTQPKFENIPYLEKNNIDILLPIDTSNNFLKIKTYQNENITKEQTKSKKTLKEKSAPDPLALDLCKLIVQIEQGEDENLSQVDDKFIKTNNNCKSSLPINGSDCHENENLELYPFICDICKRMFKNKNALLSHQKNHEKMPSCQHCGKHFRKMSTFKTHNPILCAQVVKRGHKLRSELPDLKCKYCEKTFKITASLKKHEGIHEDSPFKCNSCPKKFMAKHLMEDHIRTHTGEKPYKCEYCPVSFANATNLKRHILIHVGERTYICTLGCGKAFYTARDRTGHERSHTGEKPFVCELCGLHFAFQHKLSLHKKRFHMDKKNYPHKCDQCDKVFVMPKQLREHSVVHTGEKLFECDICFGRFGRANGLREHKKLHSGVKKHICTICNKAFAQSAGLYGHIKSHGIVKENNGISELFAL